ncbi:MAG: bifunctional nicotinamidase/pyrazinamidase [bacterium]|nr:bifunctional nicotinamidase/pyrazinamidase [bacterium]
MRALNITDLQNDFMPGGALAVPEGDRVIAPANRLIQHFEFVVATQDWHPHDHGSFAANHPGCEVGSVIELGGLPQILWPVHCVQDTFGADFHPNLETARIRRIFHKGVDPHIDSYSGFYDNGHRRSTGLGEYLRDHDVDELFILGLATDYCVKYSVLDALHMGFRVAVIEDACRGIERQARMASAYSARPAAPYSPLYGPSGPWRRT